MRVGSTGDADSKNAAHWEICPPPCIVGYGGDGRVLYLHETMSSAASLEFGF